VITVFILKNVLVQNFSNYVVEIGHIIDENKDDVENSDLEKKPSTPKKYEKYQKGKKRITHYWIFKQIDVSPECSYKKCYMSDHS